MGLITAIAIGSPTDLRMEVADLMSCMSFTIPPRMSSPKRASLIVFSSS